MGESQKMFKSFRSFARKSVVSTGRKVVPRRLRPAFNPLRKFLRRVLNKFDKSVEEQNRLGRMIGPLGYWEEMQDYQIDLLKQLGLQPHHALLDIGCGPLSGGLAFIPYLDVGCYFGVDIRESAIEEAHKQVAKAGLVDKNPTLTVSSTFGSKELDGQKFDYVWASQTMYHLDPKLRDSCLAYMATCLNPDGKFYADVINDAARVTPDKHWFEFSFHFHSLDALTESSEKCGLQMTNLGRIADFGYPVEWELKENFLIEFRRA
jgi:SAM-dependent methyltransferase